MVSTVHYHNHHNPPQAPRPATVIPAHIQPLQKRAYIPYPTFLLHGQGSESSVGQDDDLPWILISTSASEAPHASRVPKPRQQRPAPPLPPLQAQELPYTTGPIRYCSQTFHEHRRLSRKPMSADLHSLYSLHSDDSSTSSGGDCHTIGSSSGASRSSSNTSFYSSCSNINYNYASTRASRSSIDSLPSQRGHQYERFDPLQEIMASHHSPDSQGSFFARRAASLRMASPPKPQPAQPKREVTSVGACMPTAAEMSPKGILRFAPSPRRSRKRVSFKREPELEEPITLSERGSFEWEVLDEPQWEVLDEPRWRI